MIHREECSSISSTGNFEDSGAGNGSVVANLLAGGKDNVLLTVEALRNLNSHLDRVVDALKM